MGPVNHIFSVLLQFEKFSKNIKIFLSNKNSDSHFLIFLYDIKSEVLKMLSNTINSYLYSLLDIVGLDLTKLKNYNLFFNIEDIHLNSNFFERLVIYSTLNYSYNHRIIYYCFSDIKSKYISLENTYYNANWLERELVEFFNINIAQRSDTRNLLLDYNFQGNPLLKNYPTEGYKEIFFNHLSYNLEYINTEFIEL